MAASGLRQPASAPLRFSPERPLAPDELEVLDCTRLQPTIQALANGLRSHWRASGEARPNTARVFGLHGALGQGKSSVMHSVLKLLQDDTQSGQPVLPLLHGWHWPQLFLGRHGHRRQLRATWVKASVLSPGHLNATLVTRLVLPDLLRHALPMGVISALALVLLGWMLAKVAGLTVIDARLLGSVHSVVLFVAAFMAGPLVLAVLGSLLVRLNAEHGAGHLEDAVYRLASWTGAVPDLVVLDDLDRASIDQQRAVLHALVRHTELLQCPLVVCFDETELLASEPKPEEPAELLRKLIQVPLRLPPRSREDAVLLAWGAGRVWQQENPQRKAWAGFVVNPVWVGQLAQVMVLTESTGPRRAKALLTEAVLAAEVLCPWRPGSVVGLDEASALLLLAAIGQIQPLIRRDPDLLLACLEAGGGSEAWHAWAAQPSAAALFKWLDARPREAAHLQALLRLADTMMPVATGWRRLLLGRGAEKAAAMNQPSGTGMVRGPEDLRFPAVSHALRQEGFYDRLVDLGEQLDDLGRGTRGTEVLDLALGRWLAGGVLAAEDAQDDAVLRLMWPLLVAGVAAWPEDHRARASVAIHRWLGQLASVQARALQMRWLRSWVVDAESHGDCDHEFWRAQMQVAAAHDPATAFVVLKVLRRRSQGQADTLSQATWLAALQMNGLSVHPHAITAALAGGHPVPPTAPPDDVASFRVAAMHRWPAVRDSGLDCAGLCRELALHMGAVRAWLPAAPSGDRQDSASLLVQRSALDRPWSLTSWMVSPSAGRLQLGDWLDALAPLCEPAGPSGSWSFGHWAYLRQYAPAVMTPDTPALQAQLLQGLSGRRWTAALCLLLQGWGGGLTQAVLSDTLWPALMADRPDRLEAHLASDLLVLWADTTRLWSGADGEQCNDPAGEKVRVGALWLGPQFALGWLQFLLNCADQADTQVLPAIERCLRVWRDGMLTGEHADFYRGACDAARMQGIEPPSV